jgi:5'-nucleotidase
MAKRLFFCAFGVIALFACKKSTLECFALLTTTDVHGAVLPHTHRVGDKVVRYGGLTGVGAYLTILRQRYGKRLLLVDAGDLYQGTLLGSMSRGRAVIEAYNLLGYDAATLGNHEFDFGALSPESHDPLGVVKRRVAEAQFPFLALNVFDRTTRQPIAWPNTCSSVLLDVGGVPVGIIGVSTVETPLVTRSEFVASLEFRDPAPLIAKEARSLRARGARAVVLIGHLGGRCDAASLPHDLSTCELSSELFRLIRSLPKDTVDVAVGGHRHQSIAHWVKGVATIEATASARQLGWIDVCIRPTGGIDIERSTIHPLLHLCIDEWHSGGCQARKTAEPVRPARFLGQPVVPPVALEQAMRPYVDQMHSRYAEPLGIDLPVPLLRSEELGRLVCDAIAKASGADIAIQNLGGVRADLAAGALTFGEVFEVLPFDNRIAVLTLSGDELVRMLAHMYGRRGKMPYLRGLDVKTNASGLDVRLATGGELRAKDTYVVATNDFLAYGGEGLNEIIRDRSRIRVLDVTVLRALIEHLEVLYSRKMHAPPPTNSEAHQGNR